MKVSGDLLVTKSNSLINARYSLTLNEQRALLCCIAQIDSRPFAEPISDRTRFVINARDFATVCGISNDQAYRDLRMSAKRLMRRVLIIKNPDASRTDIEEREIHWIRKADYIKKGAAVELYLSEDILPYISQLQGFFRSYKLKYLAPMKSSYGIRLYELVSQWRDSRNSMEFEIDDLRRLFELENKYKNSKDFRRNVIDPAVDDINSFTDIELKYTIRKTNGAVSHLNFIYQTKVAAVSIDNIANETIEENLKQEPLKRKDVNKERVKGETYTAAEERLIKSGRLAAKKPRKSSPRKTADESSVQTDLEAWSDLYNQELDALVDKELSDEMASYVPSDFIDVDFDVVL